MQHIATDKSQFAALPIKVAPHKSHSINQQIEFQSFLREANPIYSQPVEPKRIAVDRAPERQVNSASAADRQYDRAALRNDDIERQQRDRQSDDVQAISRRDATEQDRKSASATSVSEKQNDAKPLNKTDSSDKYRNATRDSAAAEVSSAEKSSLDKSNAEETEQKLSASETVKPSKDVVQNKTADVNTALDDKSTDQSMTELTDQDGLENNADVEIDWLALVESSLRTDLATNSKSDVVSASIDNETASMAENASKNIDKSVEIASPIIIPKDASNSQDIEHLLVTEQQVKADMLISNAEITTQKQLTALAELLNKPVNSEDAIAKIDQAIKELLLSQDAKAQITQLLESENNELALAALTSATALGVAKDNNSIDAEARLRTLIAGDTETSSDTDTRLNTETSSDTDTRLNTETSSDTDTRLNTETSLDAELLVALSVPEQMASTLDKKRSADNNNSSSPATPVNLETATPVELVPAALIATENVTKQVVNAIPDEVKQLMSLPEPKLDAALANLADRLVSDAGKNRIDSTVQGLEKIALGADPAAVKADFVSALKAGIEEFKSQLQQGHQPSIDLTSLVAESMAKTTGMQVTAEQVSGTVSRFNQTLELSSLLRTHHDNTQLSSQIERVASKDTLTQAQVVQNKQSQQIAQFDKAVNITRNEGLQQMAEKVRWMVNQNNLQAEIRLDPPDLGSMKVRVNMAGDAATVSIVVQSQQAREALEQATPRLKELLEQQGIELGQSSVQQEQNGNDAEQQGQFAGGRSDQQDLSTEETAHLEQPIHNGRLGGIDYFV